MNKTAALLDWGAAVSFGYLTTTTVAAIQLPYFLVAMTLIVGVVTLWDRPRRFVVYLGTLAAAAILARLVIVEAVRLVIRTIRPYDALSFIPLIEPPLEFSFPSGHVAVLSALAFLAMRIRPMAGTALLSGAVIVGAARVLAGVHWPIDIIGRILAGLLAAFLVSLAERRFFPSPSART